jgi:hypothetical protein
MTNNLHPANRLRECSYISRTVGFNSQSSVTRETDEKVRTEMQYGSRQLVVINHRPCTLRNILSKLAFLLHRVPDVFFIQPFFRQYLYEYKDNY